MDGYWMQESQWTAIVVACFLLLALFRISQRRRHDYVVSSMLRGVATLGLAGVVFVLSLYDVLGRDPYRVMHGAAQCVAGFASHRLRISYEWNGSFYAWSMSTCVILDVVTANISLVVSCSLALFHLWHARPVGLEHYKRTDMLPTTFKSAKLDFI